MAVPDHMETRMGNAHWTCPVPASGRRHQTWEARQAAVVTACRVIQEVQDVPRKLPGP